MALEKGRSVIIENHTIASKFLERTVKVDCYFPDNIPNIAAMSLLLINDGQDLVTMQFEDILETLYASDAITPLLCVGIHCGEDRRSEYGTAKMVDYKGRGAKAPMYNKFVFEELLPFIRQNYSPSFVEKCYAGFSLGGLSALDIVWNNPREFTKVGVFSGSLWWRDKSQDDETFDENEHRIMHRQVREGSHYPWLRFFFEVGTLDETADRNNNGVIDSIDDTVALITELTNKGYDETKDIRFIQIKDGKHDVPTWARAFPDFLKWNWGYNNEVMD
jgi:enterochelin esterase-like enzyme